ncbi:endoglucanase A-like [Aplysia californica]|uniref:Endoglucanase n=1 Tax=Aplysia californica TaxID=6500 RepID=A0ABM1VVT1_APLCA|nr:endoglucanase A-like [Aplysia californica]
MLSRNRVFDLLWNNRNNYYFRMTSLYLVSALLLVAAPSLVLGAKDYSQALGLSNKFYEAQRSGPINDKIVPWRGNSGMSDCTVGGWYDAGDHLKFGLPMADSAHTLLWSLYRFKDGYTRANQLNQMYHMIKTPLNYFKAAWDPALRRLTAQVGDGTADHAFWGRPEDMKMSRPCMYVDSSHVGSDIAGETAASLALGYLTFKQKESGYATQLLNKAKSLYAFAKTRSGVFTGSSQYYPSGNWKDEMCLGAVWLYRATGTQSYLNDAKSYVNLNKPWAQGWEDKMLACQLLMFEETKDAKYKNAVINFFNDWATSPGAGKVDQTPCGLVWRSQWGANRYAANAAFIALVAAEDGINAASYRKFAVEQINYILGDNKKNAKQCFSYEIGYGNHYPQQPHHRGSSCPSHGTCNQNANGPNPHVLLGALVGGPKVDDSYTDVRSDYIHNEVTTDYNSGFQGALAGIVHLQQRGALPRTSNKCPCPT